MDDDSFQQAQAEQEQQEQTMNIYQRMAAIMKTVGYVQKEEKKVNGQYTFVSHDAVTSKMRPALIEHGVLAVPTVKRHLQDGNRTEADVLVRFVNIDNPEDFIEIEMFGYGVDPQDKGPGKAISYAVKYALLKAFSLETGDDPERDNIAFEPPQKEKTGLSPKHVDGLVAKIKKADSYASLKKLFVSAYREAESCGDELAMEVLTAAKDDRKSQLEEMVNA